jgi:hypothetical protein
MDVDNVPFAILLFKDGCTPETVELKRLPLGLAFPIRQVGNPCSVSIATDPDNDIS